MEQAFYAVVEIGEEIRSISDAHRFLEQLSAHFGVDNLAYLGVNVDNDFAPVYIVPANKKPQVAKLRLMLKGSL